MSEVESTRAGEIYKPIEGYPGYLVSNFGDVQSCWTRGKSSRMISHWRSLKQHFSTGGYARISIQRNSEPFTLTISRLVLKAFVGPCPEGMECRHLDGNQKNNRLDNLRWGTHIENEADKTSHGTRPYGANNVMAKITDDDVREIRRLCESGHKPRDVAKIFGMTQPNISCIARRFTWKHVT